VVIYKIGNGKWEIGERNNVMLNSFQHPLRIIRINAKILPQGARSFSENSEF